MQALLQRLLVPIQIIADNLEYPVQVSLNRLDESEVKLAIFNYIDALRVKVRTVARQAICQRIPVRTLTESTHCSDIWLVLRKQRLENLVDEQCNRIANLLIDHFAVWQLDSQNRLVHICPIWNSRTAFLVQNLRSMSKVVILQNLVISRRLNADIRIFSTDMHSVYSLVPAYDVRFSQSRNAVISNLSVRISVINVICRTSNDYFVF